jgi:hypothetical protein
LDVVAEKSRRAAISQSKGKKSLRKKQRPGKNERDRYQGNQSGSKKVRITKAFGGSTVPASTKPKPEHLKKVPKRSTDVKTKGSTLVLVHQTPSRLRRRQARDQLFNREPTVLSKKQDSVVRREVLKKDSVSQGKRSRKELTLAVHTAGVAFYDGILVEYESELSGGVIKGQLLSAERQTANSILSSKTYHNFTWSIDSKGKPIRVKRDYKKAVKGLKYNGSKGYVSYVDWKKDSQSKKSSSANRSRTPKAEKTVQNPTERQALARRSASEQKSRPGGKKASAKGGNLSVQNERILSDYDNFYNDLGRAIRRNSTDAERFSAFFSKLMEGIHPADT